MGGMRDQSLPASSYKTSSLWDNTSLTSSRRVPLAGLLEVDPKEAAAMVGEAMVGCFDCHLRQVVRLAMVGREVMDRSHLAKL